MNIIVNRKWLDDKSSIGEMWIDGKFFCYTLEDKVRDVKIQNVTAIPCGEYDITITDSTHFGRPMPLINNVPGFSGVRIHSGNTDADTDGCILIGYDRDPDFIGESRAAFSRFFSLLQSALVDSKVTLTVQITPNAVDKRSTTK